MERFTFKPLAENEIRLVKFDTSQPDVSLILSHQDMAASETVNFVALSYCWGDPHRTCDIRIDGAKGIEITQSLQIALMHLKSYFKDSERVRPWMWIDQICLDQSNVEERNHQVQGMWKVFSRADRVFAWLTDSLVNAGGCHSNGLSATQSQRETRFLGKWKRYEQTYLKGHHRLPKEDEAEDENASPVSADDFVDYESLPNSDLEPVYENVSILAHELKRSGWVFDKFHLSTRLASTALMLVKQKYFSRTWIIPEILQARDLIFFHGADFCASDELREALDLMVRSGWKTDISDLIRVKDILDSRGVDFSTLYGRNMSEQAVYLRVLESLHYTDCTDIRDRIYAALSTPSLSARQQGATFQPDYRLSRDELVVMLIRHLDKIRTNEYQQWNFGEISRVISRSLMLGSGVNTSSAYEADVTKSLLSCTRPWKNGESLVLRSGVEVGSPERLMRHYLRAGNIDEDGKDDILLASTVNSGGYGCD